VNRVLARQLRRLGLSPEQPPATAAEWHRLLERVEAYYDEADRSRYLLERAMELSSREMLQLNRAVEELSSKRAERSEQHYRTLFHQLPVGALEEDYRKVVAHLDGLRRSGVTDLHAHFEGNPEEVDVCIGLVEVVDCNRAVVELLRAPDRSALIGRFDSVGLTQSARDAWEIQFVAIWNGERQIRVDFTGSRFDGSEFSTNLHWTAAEFDGVLQYERVMVVLIDITERTATEQRMRDLVRSKDEFLASVSHELRTPLTSVLGYASLAREEQLDPGERSTMLETIAEQATDLSNIVEDLLVGARSELGQLGVNPVEIDLVALIEQLRPAFGSLVSDLELSCPPEAAIAVGDAARVRQILRNLITNAARYGGPHVILRVGRDQDSIRVAVCDDGEPLMPNVAERIFDRYYRGDPGDGQPGSVGIGLTIARDLSRLMGGDLTYRHDGTWGVFELTLPAATKARAA
jgi:signal transduction histidine kinase